MACVVKAEDDRQPLVVDDVLPLGDEDAARLLEETLVVPAGVPQLQRRRQPVVLAGEDGVHHGQSALLVDARLAAPEADPRAVHTGVALLILLWRRRRPALPLAAAPPAAAPASASPEEAVPSGERLRSGGGRCAGQRQQVAAADDQQAVLEGAQPVRLLLLTAVQHRRVQEGGELIDGRGRPGDAVRLGRRQGANQTHTPLAEPTVERVVGGDLYGDALRVERRGGQRLSIVLTALDGAAVRQLEDERVVEVVVNELSPLHHREGEAAQFPGDAVHNAFADEPWARQRLAGDASPARLEDVVLEGVLQEPLETGQRTSLSRSLQVVTLAVGGPESALRAGDGRLVLTAGDAGRLGGGSGVSGRRGAEPIHQLHHVTAALRVEGAQRQQVLQTGHAEQLLRRVGAEVEVEDADCGASAGRAEAGAQLVLLLDGARR